MTANQSSNARIPGCALDCLLNGFCPTRINRKDRRYARKHGLCARAAGYSDPHFERARRV